MIRSLFSAATISTERGNFEQKSKSALVGKFSPRCNHARRKYPTGEFTVNMKNKRPDGSMFGVELGSRQ
jgi:hypothetical protein